MKIKTNSLKETQKIAVLLAGELLKEKPSKTGGAFVLALSGELGSGKTSFTQGLAKGLGIKEKVKSPSFLLLKKYEIPKTKRSLVHLDCYRLEKFKDLEAIGFEEFLADPRNIVAVEWADKIKKHLPEENILFLNLEYSNGRTRTIEIAES